MARRYRTIRGYIAREFLLSFIVAFLFFFFIFFVNNVLLLAEEVLSKRVAPLDVLRLVIYSLPQVVALAFPFASLVGALMAMGRLSSNSEIIAFLGSGVSRKTIFVPFLVLGLVFTVVSFEMDDYFIPVGNINFNKLYRDILLSTPGLELEPFSVKRFQNTVIVTGEVKGQKISDILIIDDTPEKNKRTISARSAVLAQNQEQRGVISLELTDVNSETPDAKTKQEFDYFQAKSMIYNILLSDISPAVGPPGPREMSSLDVYRAIVQKKAQQQVLIRNHDETLKKARMDLAEKYYALAEALRAGSLAQATRQLRMSYADLQTLEKKQFRDRSIQTYEIEFYKKFSLPVGCLVFIVFAFPVGLLARRSGRAVGFGIGLFVSIVYWGLLFAGQTLGYRLDFSPFLSMWLPDFLILAAGIVLMVIRSSE